MINYRVWELFSQKYNNYSGYIVGINCINIQNHISIKYAIELIKETIKWWKLKNKVKRPITSNDALAYKQILTKLQKFN